MWRPTDGGGGGPRRASRAHLGSEGSGLQHAQLDCGGDHRCRGAPQPALVPHLVLRRRPRVRAPRRAAGRRRPARASPAPSMCSRSLRPRALLGAGARPRRPVRAWRPRPTSWRPRLRRGWALASVCRCSWTRRLAMGAGRSGWTSGWTSGNGSSGGGGHPPPSETARTQGRLRLAGRGTRAQPRPHGARDMATARTPGVAWYFTAGCADWPTTGKRNVLAMASAGGDTAAFLSGVALRRAGASIPVTNLAVRSEPITAPPINLSCVVARCRCGHCF